MLFVLLGQGGIQWRGAPSTTDPPRSALDLRDTQLEGLAGENELELEAGIPVQEDGEGARKEDPTLFLPWVPTLPPTQTPSFPQSWRGWWRLWPALPTRAARPRS